jgi:hypothetical protein
MSMLVGEDTLLTIDNNNDRSNSQVLLCFGLVHSVYYSEYYVIGRLPKANED